MHKGTNIHTSSKRTAGEIINLAAVREAFVAKGRMRPLMEFTPVYVVTEPYTGLLGAAEALGNSEV